MPSFSFQTLPSADNLNRFSYAIEVSDRRPIVMQKGRMIACYGQLRFETPGRTLHGIITSELFNLPMYANDFVIVSGQGKLILADYGRDVNSFDLENGNLTIKKQNVLAFQGGIRCQQSVMPGYLNFIGTGKFLAASFGPVHFMEPPVRVDEDALLGWADMPCPSYYHDYEHAHGLFGAIGAASGLTLSGEERQLDFPLTAGVAGTVLLQSSEFDAHGAAPPPSVGADPADTIARLQAQFPGLPPQALLQLAGMLGQR